MRIEPPHPLIPEFPLPRQAPPVMLVGGEDFVSTWDPMGDGRASHSSQFSHTELRYRGLFTVDPEHGLCREIIETPPLWTSAPGKYFDNNYAVLQLHKAIKQGVLTPVPPEEASRRLAYRRLEVRARQLRNRLNLWQERVRIDGFNIRGAFSLCRR